MKIKLIYNPYSLITHIYKEKRNGWKKVRQDTAWVKTLNGKRLHTWLISGENYDGFFHHVADALNEQKIDIHFEGRELDYLDLQSAADEYNQLQLKKATFTITCPNQFSFEVSEVKDTLKSVIHHLSTGDLRNEEEVKNAVEDYQSCMDGEFTMAVVAPMSSGKSTLINAMIGKRLMPTGNKATTAKIVRIFDNDAPDFQGEVLDKNGTCIVPKTDVTYAKVKEWNNNEESFYVNLYGDLPNISDKDLKLVLMDTPGPDNAKTDEHRMVTLSAIHDEETNPLILFVMDLTKLENTSEDSLIKEIKSAISKDKQSQERMIFVLNRADEINAKEESIQEFVMQAKNWLGNYGIESPTIIPISAQTAFLQKLSDQNELDEEDQDSLGTYSKKLRHIARNLTDAADLSLTCRKTLDAELARAIEEKNEGMETFIRSGLYGLQLTINEYLGKYAMPYKLSKCTSEILLQLKGLENRLNFKAQLAENEALLERAYDSKNALEQRKKELQKNAIDLKKLVEASAHKEHFKEIVHDSKIEASRKRNDFFNQDTDTTFPQEALVSKTKVFLDEFKVIVKELQKALKKKLEEQCTADFDEVYNQLQYATDAFKQELNQLPVYDPENVIELTRINIILNQQKNYNLTKRINAQPIPTFSKYRTEEFQKENPQKRGFWGAFKFWQPKYITDTREVYDGEHIKYGEFVARMTTASDKELDQINTDINASMISLYEDQGNACLEFVSHLNDAMDNVTAEIQQAVQEANSITNDKSKILKMQDELAKTRETIACIQDMNEQGEEI